MFRTACSCKFQFPSQEARRRPIRMSYTMSRYDIQKAASSPVLWLRCSMKSFHRGVSSAKSGLWRRSLNRCWFKSSVMRFTWSKNVLITTFISWMLSSTHSMNASQASLNSASVVVFTIKDPINGPVSNYSGFYSMQMSFRPASRNKYMQNLCPWYT